MPFRAKNSKIREYTTRANQIVRITSDFEMDVVNRLASCFSCEETTVSEQLKGKSPLITNFSLVSGFADVKKIFAVNSLANCS